MREVWCRDHSVDIILKKHAMVSGSRYRWSRFVLPFEMDGSFFLYHTFTRQCLQAGEELRSRPVLRSGYEPDYGEDGTGIYMSDETLNTRFSFDEVSDNPALRKLAEDSFLVPEQKDETESYLSVLSLLRIRARKKGYDGYMILPTLGCNARCVYCYEEGRQQVPMSPETLDRTIAFILATRRKNTKLHLKWFGGEPLLRPDVIDAVCSAMRENGIEYRSSIITNGSLITDEILSKMSGDWHLKKVQISMDCAEPEYILRKNYYRYEDTYKRVIKSAEKLARAGIAVSIRCNVDEENMDQIPVFISDLEKMIHDKNNILVYLAPLNESRKKADSLRLQQRISDSRELIERAGFRSTGTANLNRFKLNYCMADRPSGYAVITPSGELYTCEHCEPGTSYGNIFQGTTRPDILNSFRNTGNSADDIRPKCRNCIFLPECTPFSKCPTQEYYCGEDKKDRILYSLRKKAGVRDSRLQMRQEDEQGDFC